MVASLGAVGGPDDDDDGGDCAEDDAEAESSL